MPSSPFDKTSSDAPSGSANDSPASLPRAEWFRDAFDDDYLARYAHRDASEAARAVALILREIHLPTGATIFDLCCGAGRHLSALAQASPTSTILGGDLSAALLGAARRTLEAGSTGLVRLDMRVLPLRDQSVDLVTNFFTAFGYFEQDDENMGVFAEVARALRPGGWFAFDFLNASVVQDSLTDAQPGVEVDATGNVWEVRRGLSTDGKRAVKYQRRQRDGRELHESVRLFSRDEIESGLRAVGLTPTKCFGGYDGDIYDPTVSSRLIVLSRLAE